MGDVLLLSCPRTDARVTGLSRTHVSVKWPWWAVDPECDWIEWNGDVALVRDPQSHEGDMELFHTEPTAPDLAVGEVCRIGIPPTVVHVTAVDRFDPPLETGRLPRPRTLVRVLRAGRSHDPDRLEQGYEIDPDDGIPISFDLLFRPYACLVAGDEVADAAGRAWRFDTPWDWYPFDGGEPCTPAWPLRLLNRAGEADAAAGAAVTRATSTGSHEAELARWVELTQASPSRGTPPG
ncbi:hypothetical protein [Streptomyces sp. SD15]